MARLFGTDGVRGIANVELTNELAFRIGKAAAFILSRRERHPLFLVAKDSRISGDMLEAAITAGVLSAGG
ncbi:MAG: phosphoglucosamine mutase, partial [Clostridia bacterium]|nr:phosphoglucosamine mutase [Clostridia bacterium]